MSDFVWFTGVVEDVSDPNMMNRVKVRCFGFHTADKALVSTNDLPWATVMSPTTSASTSGIGTTTHGLIPGSWVVGFFRDGKGAQDPIIMGSIASQFNSAPDSSKGFADPSGVYPTSDYIGEPDVNKLARGENTITYTPDSTTGEPQSPYAAQYPYNHVTRTTSGHTIELDDTPNAERIRITHKSGTLVEFHPEGELVIRNKDKWQITAGNDRTHITGNVQVQVDGNADIKVAQNARIDISGTARMASGGNMTLVAPRIDLNPPGATVGKIVTALIDSPTINQPNIKAIPSSAVPDGADYPTNPEQVDTVVVEPVSTATCVEGQYTNPYDIAVQALEAGDWKETGYNPLIAGLWEEIGYDSKKFADQTSWCAVFVGAILKRAGMKYIQTASSRAYQSYGEAVSDITQMKRGDIVVFYRNGINSSTGHVGFATGNYTDTTIDVLGGSQGNTLKVSTFKLSNLASGWGVAAIRRPITCVDGGVVPDSDPTATGESKGYEEVVV